MCRYGFFLVVIGISCVQSTYTMELERYDNKKDTAIEMHHLWSNDYRRDVSKTKDLNLKNMRSSFKKEEYLPLGAQALDHLLYLSTIRSNNTKTLFTEKQQGKFDTAEKIKRSVPWTFGVNGAVIVGTSLFPFINFAGLAQCSSSTGLGCLSQVATIITPTVPSVVGGLTLGFVSLYATGLLPDLSSRKANKVQDEIGHLSHTYATIAKYLIDIHFENEEQSKWIARKFDIDELKQRARLKIHKTKAGNDLVSPLEEALHFIKHDHVLERWTEIEGYIYSKEHRKQIGLFGRRIESLEKTVHEQNAEIERLKQRYEEK